MNPYDNQPQVPNQPVPEGQPMPGPMPVGQPMPPQPAMPAQPEGVQQPQPAMQPPQFTAQPQPVAQPFAPQPTGFPAGPVPAQSPQFTAQPQAGTMPMQGFRQPLGKKLVKIFVPLVVIIVLAVGGFFAFKQFTGGVKLESFSNDEFSIMFPAGYEQDEKTTAVTFTEPDDDRDTRSSVFVFTDDVPSAATTQQKDDALDKIEEGLDSLVQSSTRVSQKIEDKKITRVEFAGGKAIKFVASVTEDGQRVGRIHMVAGLNDEKTFIIMVLAHVSDPGVEKNADKIIESFSFK